ncbi:hypothetical protein POUND7_008509 [Theobroma cacao]
MSVVPCLLMPWMNKTHDFVSHSNALKIKVGKVSRQHVSVCLGTSGFLDPFFKKKNHLIERP